MEGTSPYIKDVSVAGFQQEVLLRSRDVPVLVDFWAEWCAPCKTLSPLLERLTVEAGGTFELAKVDVDANQELSAQFLVQSIPTVVAIAPTVDAESPEITLGTTCWSTKYPTESTT